MSDRLTPERRAEIQQDYDDGYEKTYKCIPELLAEIDAAEAENLKALSEQSEHAQAAIKQVEDVLKATENLRDLDAEFVCGFMRVVREGECRLPPVLAEKWIEAARKFLEDDRTDKVPLPSDESWKDTWERAEWAEGERIKAMAQIEAMMKGDRHHLEKRQKAEAERDKLREVVQDFNIEECAGCYGTGHDGGDTKNDDACTYCAGHGEIITGGYPKALRAAQDSIDARS